MELQVLKTNTESWSYKDDVLVINDHELPYTDHVVKEIMSNSKIPGTFTRIDSYTDVPMLGTFMKHAMPKMDISFVTDGKKLLSAIKTGHKFFIDEKLDEIVQHLTTEIATPTIRGNEIGKSYFFPMKDVETGFMSKDEYQFGLGLNRHARGGVEIFAQSLRLVCTNGLTVSEKSQVSMFKSVEPTVAEMQHLASQIKEFDFRAFFKNKFQADGKLVKASVAEFIGIRNLLRPKVTPEELEMMLPYEPVNNYYNSNGIKLSAIPLPTKKRYSSGMTFYDLTNVATNVLSNNIKDITVDNELGKIVALPRDLKDIIKMPKGEPRFPLELLDKITGASLRRN